MEAIIEEVNGLFREAGLKTRRRLFYRDGDFLYLFVNCQKSRYSDKTMLTITINFGGVPKFGNVVEAYRPVRFTSIEQCPAFSRIGFIVGKNKDIWYEVRPDSRIQDHPDLAEDFVSFMEFVNTVDSETAFFEAYDQPYMLYQVRALKTAIALHAKRRGDPVVYERMIGKLQAEEERFRTRVLQLLGPE